MSNKEMIQQLWNMYPDELKSIKNEAHKQGIEGAAKVRVPKPDKLNIHNWEWIWDLAQDEMAEAIRESLDTLTKP